MLVILFISNANKIKLLVVGKRPTREEIKMAHEILLSQIQTTNLNSGFQVELLIFSSFLTVGLVLILYKRRMGTV